MQESEPRTEPVPAELPTISGEIERFGIRVHRPVPARVLRAHTRQVLGVILVGVSLSALALGASFVTSARRGDSPGTDIESVIAAGALGALAFAFGVGGLISRLRLRRRLAAGPSLEVVVSDNVLKLTPPNQAPHYLLRRDVQVVLDLGPQLNLVHGDRQTVVGASLEDWEDLRERLLAWAPVEKRSLRATWFWTMTPLATLALSVLAWITQEPVFSALISCVSVLLGVAVAVRVGTSRILPIKQKLLGLIRTIVFTLGALMRLALLAHQFTNVSDLFELQPARHGGHESR